jgi:hypothetical protein
LCLESDDGRSVQDYIEELSTVVVKHHVGSSLPPHTQARRRTDWIWNANEVVKYPRLKDEDWFEKDVYVAGLATNSLATVTKCVADGNTAIYRYGEIVVSSSSLFGLAFSHAVALGHRHILAALMFHTDRYCSQIWRRAMLLEIAAFGDAELLQFVFEIATERYPWEMVTVKKKPSYAHCNNWQLAGADTPSKAVFDLLTKLWWTHCVKRTFGPREYTQFLAHCAWKGWAEMAEHYISLGASVDEPGVSLRHWNFTRQQMIVNACEGGYEDVIAVFLKHGADTSTPALEVAARHGHLGIVSMLLEHSAEFGKAVYEAVAKDYRDIVAVLLSYGAKIEEDQGALREYAVAREDELLFRVLVEGGCDPMDHMTECRQRAEQDGLDSMIAFLRQVEAPTV